MSDENKMMPKMEAIESLLAQGDVLLQLDPRVEGVRVPSMLGDQPLLVLRIGLEMPIPIPDLVINETGIAATLSFDRTPHEVVVPWEAVFGMVTEQGQGLLWTADVPLEIIDQMLQANGDATSPDAEEPPEPPAPERPRLVALDGGVTGPMSSPTPDPDAGPPTLHVVK